MLAQSAPIDRYVFPQHAQYAYMQMQEHRIVRRHRNRVVQFRVGGAFRLYRRREDIPPASEYLSLH